MQRILLVLVLAIFSAQAQKSLDLNYYLPSNTTYNKNIPTPKSVIGHEVGQWHVTHDKFCLLYTSPSPRDKRQSRMPSSA